MPEQPVLVDSHCHLDRLDLSRYDGKLSGALEKARENGIERMLCVSIDLENYPAMMEQIEPYDNVYASVGVHPNETEGHDPDVGELVELSKHPKIVAIGETGLDYFHGKGDLEWQRDRFRTHIRAAIQSGKPLIIHSRDAKEDTIRILEEENAKEIGGVMHCFTEDWDMAQRTMVMNFYISFSGIVTFKNATELKDVARKVPMDRMLVETDSPYLAPVPYRGKPNEPAYVLNVAEYIAELRDTTLQDIATHTTRNFNTLFRL
jgi:TatD DNase family protein